MSLIVVPDSCPRGWFYLWNYRGALPAFTNRVLRERPAKWDWGVSPPTQQDKLEGLTDALARLAKKFATVLAEKLEADIPPIAEFDAPEGPQGGMVACRKTGPRSPCNRLVIIVVALCNRTL